MRGEYVLAAVMMSMARRWRMQLVDLGSGDTNEQMKLELQRLLSWCAGGWWCVPRTRCIWVVQCALGLLVQALGGVDESSNEFQRTAGNVALGITTCIDSL